MIKRLSFIIISLACNYLFGQEWSLKLKSTVQLRTWTLTSMADKDERNINGATIQLIQNNQVIKEVTSDAEGNFVIDIPGNGDYYLNVSYPGCNSKKFYVSTKNVPTDVTKNTYKPSVTIGGFMMAKPFKGIDYLGLQEPLLAVEYKNSDFDKDKTISDKGVQIVQGIMDAEMTLINKFTFQTKAGDEALSNKNYKLAKQCYTKALELIANEEYPKFKLAKAEDGLKEEEAKKQALEAEKAAQIEAQKIALQKKIEEKKQKENASFNQGAKPAVETETTTAIQDSVVTQKASDEKAKAEAEALAKKKAEEEKLARSRAETEAAAKKKQEDEAAAKAKADAETKAKTEAEALAKKKAEDEAKARAASNNAIKNSTTSQNTQVQNTTQTNSVNSAATTNNASSTSEVNSSNDGTATAAGVKGKAKRKIKHQIGSSYHDDISKADVYFKEENYKEAKVAYSNALKDKPNDHYATVKIAECNKRLKK